MKVLKDEHGEYVLDGEGNKLRKPYISITSWTPSISIVQGLESNFYAGFKNYKEVKEYIAILRKWLRTMEIHK